MVRLSFFLVVAVAKAVGTVKKDNHNSFFGGRGRFLFIDAKKDSRIQIIRNFLRGILGRAVRQRENLEVDAGGTQPTTHP